MIVNDSAVTLEHLFVSSYHGFEAIELLIVLVS